MSDRATQEPQLAPHEFPGQLLSHGQTLDGILGVEVVSVSADEVVSRTRIDDRHRQPFGLVHGGFYALVAESSASIGGSVAVAGRGAVAMGSSNNTAFMRPFIGDGVITSTAKPIHQGRTTQIWDVEHRGDDGRLYATSRVTLAVRPNPAGGQRDG